MRRLESLLHLHADCAVDPETPPGQNAEAALCCPAHGLAAVADLELPQQSSARVFRMLGTVTVEL
ncbi:hypothetical protein GCM10010390_26730 [Streptomyces mordarskii]|uniref:Uncharacterized protein n=1 Tax=Streptomyces mordarskii TaxID=1226758 RepID=A0ABP3MQG5_9ACTN